jgi:hypothetical protein
LRRAAISSQPDDAGQSFDDLVVDASLMSPAWELRFFYLPQNCNKPSVMTAQRTRFELCVDGKSTTGLVILL